MEPVSTCRDVCANCSGDRYDTSACCHSGQHSWFPIISQGDRMVIKLHTHPHTHKHINTVEQMDATNKPKGIASAAIAVMLSLSMDRFSSRKKPQSVLS